MSFQLSPEVDKNKIFLVKLSELEGRLDPHFYMPKFINNENQLLKIDCTKLSHQSQAIFSGITPKSGGASYCKQEAGIPFIRSGDFLENGEIDFSELLHIKPDVHNGIMKSSQVKQNDVLIAIVGATIGKIGIYQNNKSANINQAIAAVRLKPGIEPKFVRSFLLTSIGQKAIDRIKRPVARANLNLEEVASLNIPNFSIPNQNIIIRAMDSAYVAKKQKEAEAQRLLDGIDGYLLGELGIELPAQAENTLQSRIFTRQLSEVSGGRFDAQSYLPYYDSLIHNIKDGKHLLHDIGSVVKKIARPFNPNQTQEYSYVQLGSIGRGNSEIQKIRKIKYPDIPSRAQQVVNSGEILFSIANPQWGVHIFVKDEYNNYAASSGFVILKSETENNIFITELLRTALYKTLYEKYLTGAGLFLNISEKNLMCIKIPLPPLEKQTEIANHITKIRSRAKELQKQAKTGLEQAKKEIEAIILGEDASNKQ